MLSRNRLEATISLAEDEVAVGGLDHRLSRKSGEVLGSMCSLALDQEPKPMLAGLGCAPRMSAALQGHRHVAPAIVARENRRQQRARSAASDHAAILKLKTAQRAHGRASYWAAQRACE